MDAIKDLLLNAKKVPLIVKKMLIFNLIIENLKDCDQFSSNYLATILGLSNHEIMCCAQELNVFYPDFVELRLIRVLGSLHCTTAGEKILRVDHRKWVESGGGISLENYARLLSTDFIKAATVSKWISVKRLGEKIYVFPGPKRDEFSSGCQGLKDLLQGINISEKIKQLLVDNNLLATDVDFPCYLIRKGKNYPSSENMFEEMWKKMLVDNNQQSFIDPPTGP